jgi:hypothetical protein
MSIQRELIAKAVRRRFNELRLERLSQLTLEKFDAASAVFISQTRERLLNAAPEDLKNSLPAPNAPDSWMESDADCLASLRRLSLNEPLRLRAAPHPPSETFLQDLNACGREPVRRFQLLNTRYRCPLNFALDSEAEVREYVLMRWMVQDRSRLEKDSLAAINSDDLLLKLNLTAIAAARNDDLRFLDALNYYYELLPATWQPPASHGWLVVSYYALYAHALAAWI